MLFGLFAGEESFDCLVGPSEGCGPGHTVSGVEGELGEPLDSRSAASAASLRSRTARRRRCRCWADMLRRSAQLIMLLLLYYHYVAIVWMRSRVSGFLSLSLSLSRPPPFVVVVAFAVDVFEGCREAAVLLSPRRKGLHFYIIVYYRVYVLGDSTVTTYSVHTLNTVRTVYERLIDWSVWRSNESVRRSVEVAL